MSNSSKINYALLNELDTFVQNTSAVNKVAFVPSPKVAQQQAIAQEEQAAAEQAAQQAAQGGQPQQAPPASPGDVMGALQELSGMLEQTFGQMGQILSQIRTQQNQSLQILMQMQVAGSYAPGGAGGAAAKPKKVSPDERIDALEQKITQMTAGIAGGAPAPAGPPAGDPAAAQQAAQPQPGAAPQA